LKKIGLTALFIVLAFAGTMIYARSDSRADSTTPGSVEDPLVTKSYVDSLLAGRGTGGGQGTAQGVGTEVVTVNPGEVLLGKAGSQFVLRAGKGIAYSPDANGISDVTDGKDIKNGEPVANNHLLIFPREGRGVMPDPKAGARLTVLVIGGYVIANAPAVVES